MWRARIVIAVVTAAACGGAVAALTASGSSSDPAVTQTATVSATAPAGRAEVGSVDQQQRQLFSVFSNSPSGQASLPASVTDSPGIANAGGNRELTRAVAVPSGRKLYVTPASGQVCLSDVLQNSCGSTSNASAGYLVELEICAPGLANGQSRIFGLVPDGVTSVAVQGAGSTRASVTDNVYDAEISGAPSGVSFTNAAGVEQQIPLSAPGGACETPSPTSGSNGG